MLNFGNFVNEKLHINKDVDEYSDIIYDVIKNGKKNKYIFTDIPKDLGIYKLTIIVGYLPGSRGYLDVGKSFKKDNKWNIFIYLDDAKDIDTLKHEMNHAFRLTKFGKNKATKSLSALKVRSLLPFESDDVFSKFFHLMYMSSEEEINSKVIETYSYMKNLMNDLGVDYLDKTLFITMLKSSSVYGDCETLIDYKTSELFKEYSESDINEFFYILKEEQKILDDIVDSKFYKLNMFLKITKSMLKKKYKLGDRKIEHSVKRGARYYDNYYNKQGEKLRRRLISLYAHFTKKDS